MTTGQTRDDVAQPDPVARWSAAPYLLGSVRPVQAVHRVGIPLAILVGYSFGPIIWPPLFTAGLGWLTRIAVERTWGRGLPAGKSS
jgi:hypothetical protein